MRSTLFPSLARRAALASFALVALFPALGAIPSMAFAARTLESQINAPGFYGVGIDSDGNIWTAGTGGESGKSLNEFSPHPSQTLLGDFEWSTGGSDYGLGVAVSEASREAFLFNPNGCNVGRFELSGQYEGKLEQHELGERGCNPYEGSNGFTGAADNSSGPSGGRLYLAYSYPSNEVDSYDARINQRPFPATEPYILEGARLNGTPTGRFADVTNVAVDSEGNLYVVDRVHERVDEFDSTGIFLRAFTGAGVPGGFAPVEGEEGYSGGILDYHGGLLGVAIDPTNGNVLIANSGGAIDEFDSNGNFLAQIHVSGTIGGNPAVDAAGNLYVGTGSEILIYSPAAPRPRVTYEAPTNPTATAGTVHATIDPNGGEVTECSVEYVEAANYEPEASNPYGKGHTGTCSPDPSTSHVSSPTDVEAQLSGLTTETTYHYRVLVHDEAGDVGYGADQTYTPYGVLGLRTEEADSLSESGSTLHASFTSNGESTHYYFEWGQTTFYGKKTPEGVVAPGSGTAQQLSADLVELPSYTTFHYRIVATNGSGKSVGEDHYFTTLPERPSISAESVSNVHTSTALIEASLDPHDFVATYHAEYVDDSTYREDVAENGPGHGFDHAVSQPAKDASAGVQPGEVSVQLANLKPGVTYHYRFVASSHFGTRVGPERTFTTYPFRAEVNDSCPNAHVRQQTGVRAHFSTAAPMSSSPPPTRGGYDVESNLIPGQTPFAGYPEARGRVLYGVHDGGIPGTGHPTNRGIDPYVATRGNEGWSTEYVGIPANDTLLRRPLLLDPLEADASLETFAFGGSGNLLALLCRRLEPAIPVHLPNGELVQGMAGSDRPRPAAKPDGHIAKHLSANGEHFIFGSTSRFAPGGNDERRRLDL